MSAHAKVYGTTLAPAFERAVVAHEGQTDKAGEPYIGHVLRVMARVSRYGATTMTVAALHDAVEDGHATLASIHNDFGGMVGDAVDAITRREGEAYGAYIQRVATNQLATRVKFADLADNSDPLRLQSLPWPEHERLTKKYRQAFMALREAAPREEGE